MAASLSLHHGAHWRVSGLAQADSSVHSKASRKHFQGQHKQRLTLTELKTPPTNLAASTKASCNQKQNTQRAGSAGTRAPLKWLLLHGVDITKQPVHSSHSCSQSNHYRRAHTTHTRSNHETPSSGDKEIVPRALSIQGHSVKTRRHRKSTYEPNTQTQTQRVSPNKDTTKHVPNERTRYLEKNNYTKWRQAISKHRV